MANNRWREAAMLLRNPITTPKGNFGRPMRIGFVFPRPSLSFALLVVLMTVLVVAGGASRESVAGQVLVRIAAFLVLVIQVLFGPRPVTTTDVKGPLLILAAVIALTSIQLVPLPPTLWRVLPGREAVEEIAGTGVWRSWSFVPGATVNALVSLAVPVAVLVTATALSKDEKCWLPGLCLLAVTIEMLLGLVQFSGVAFDNPLINDTPGGISGTFANRNHFALFLALGCVIIPVWMFRDGRRLGWRGSVGLGLLLLFVLMILASGSRAGLAAGGLAVLIAAVLSLRGLRSELRNAPRWVLPGVMIVVGVIIASFLLASVAAGRAISVQRSLVVDIEQDLRSRALPTVWSMTSATFPAGNGVGAFDPMFRASEPSALLKPSYFNQVHNDFVDVPLSSGLPGLLLLGAALTWWAVASVRAWRNRTMLPRLGSAILLLIMLASAFDYPARTPIMMAMIVLAMIWLSNRHRHDGVSALPRSGQHL